MDKKNANYFSTGSFFRLQLNLRKPIHVEKQKIDYTMQYWAFVINKGLY